MSQALRRHYLTQHFLYTLLTFLLTAPEGPQRQELRGGLRIALLHPIKDPCDVVHPCILSSRRRQSNANDELFGAPQTLKKPHRFRCKTRRAWTKLGITQVGNERSRFGVELFYNVGVTPWLHITPDLQVITPILGRAETSVVLGLRMKIDF